MSRKHKSAETTEGYTTFDYAYPSASTLLKISALSPTGHPKGKSVTTTPDKYVNPKHKPGNWYPRVEGHHASIAGSNELMTKKHT